MRKNLAITSLQFVAVDIIGDILFWPIWWYTKGLVNAVLSTGRNIKEQAEALGIGVWLRNIFTPMFGQYDIEGRIISFFMRLIQIIVRTVGLVFWSLIYCFFFALWIFLPPLVVYQLWYNAQGLL